MFACQIEQDEPSGQGKKLIGADLVDKKGESCSLFLVVDRAKQEELQEQARNDMTAAGMPVPENFNVYEVIDMVATQQNNQEVNTGSQNKRVIVSKKAEKLILNDCIRCLLICDKTPEGTGFCQFTLQLKDGKDEIISNNLDDTFVFYGAGETGIDATATYSEGNRTISKTKKNVPAICTFGEKRAPDGGPGSGGVERSCVPIYVDRDTCMKAGYMLYAGLALHAVAWEVSRITTRVGISLTSRALPPLLVRRVSSAMVNCS